MKCVIPGQNVKLFARSIHCLSRIGDELFFEALEDGLALRTVNTSRSAYACFVFTKNFLGEYEQGADQIDSSNASELLKCKITMKSCLAIFKSLATIEKIVDMCKIIFQPDQCRLVFILHCKHGIVKTHNLTYQECESLQAVFGKDLCPNAITAQSKVLQDTVVNFPNSCEEITVSVCPEYVKITNYIDDEPDPSKVVHTVMTLVPEEFDYFQIGIDTKVTFCLKELRAILAFSEYVNQPLSIHFEQAGKPIVFSFDSDNLYIGDFVMATLSENDAPVQTSQQRTAVSTVENNNARLESNRKRTGVSVNNENKLKEPSTLERKETNDNQFSNNNVVGSNKEKIKKNDPNKKVQKTFQGSNAGNCIPETVPCRTQSTAPNNAHISNSPNPADDFFSESFPYQKGIFSSATNTKKSEKRSNEHIRSNCSILRTATNNDNDIVMSDENDVLESTPPPVKKKFKSIFFGESLDNSNRNESITNPITLAADTDDEDD